MITDFQQGIITYPSSNNQQVFLAKIGLYVSLQTANGRTDITFAHKTENYLYTESSDAPTAWGPLQPNTDYWLYWDINLLTAVRTFGFTTIAPITSTIEPIGVDGLHWFNQYTRQMYVYQVSGWIEVVRVFAAKVNNNNFDGMGNNSSPLPFAGSQVGLNISGTVSGRIIVDDTGTPIRRSNGQFFSTEDEFFINGSPANTIRLEANVINGTALENIARYQVVKFTQFGCIHLAGYDDVQTTVIAMSMEDLIVNQTGTLCVQGVITNPAWTFDTVGAELWVTSAGLLTDVDPYVTDPVTHIVSKVPVARVLTRTSIVFDQGLGGKGDKGDSAQNAPVATTTVLGVSKLSLPATDVLNPVVVGTNDPRLLPYIHPSTHPATMITTDSHSILTGLNVQTQLHQLSDRNLDSISDVIAPSPSINDYIKWNGTNWVNGKQNLDDLLDVMAPSPSINDYVKWDGSNWVNAPIEITGIDPIVIVNLMGDDLIDAPIAIPATGASISIEAYNKNPFEITDNLFECGEGSGPYYLTITVNGQQFEVEFDDYIVHTVQDLITTLNDALLGVAVAEFVESHDQYNNRTTSIVISTIEQGAHTTISMIDGKWYIYYYRQRLLYNWNWQSCNYVGSYIGTSIPGSDAVHSNYVDEYYIVGNLPTNIPAQAPVFEIYIQSEYQPATESDPLTIFGTYQFQYFITPNNRSDLFQCIVDLQVGDTIGTLVNKITAASFGRLLCTFDEPNQNIVITNAINDQTATRPPYLYVGGFDFSANNDGTGEAYLFNQNIIVGGWVNFHDIGPWATWVVPRSIPGTSTDFQTGIWAKSGFKPGELVCYDKLGRWKSLGYAHDILYGKRVGIALKPQSGRLASGSFAGKDGQIAVYSA